MKIVYVLLFFISSSIIGQENWQLAKDKDGIAIWTRNFQDSSYKEYKAVTYIITSMDAVVHELLDAPKYVENCIAGVSHLIATNPGIEYLFYAKNKLPWPLRDRDVISRLTMGQQSENSIRLNIKAAPKELPTINKTLRIKELEGYWLLEREGDKIKVTQQLYFNPEGNLPPFVTNSLLVKGPFNTFSELRDKLGVM